MDISDDENLLEKTVELDLEQVKINLPQYSSEKLCEMIVCDRYFGFGQAISELCMQELANRRTSGNDFNFETYIQQEHDKLPKLDFKLPDLRTVLQNAINLKKGNR